MAELKHFKSYPQNVINEQPRSTCYTNEAIFVDSDSDICGRLPSSNNSITMEDSTPPIRINGDMVMEEEETLREDSSSRAVRKVHYIIYGFLHNYSDLLWKLFYLLLLILYVAYFIGAMMYRFGDEGSLRLLVVTVLVALYLVYWGTEFLVTRGMITWCHRISGWNKFMKWARKIRLYTILTVVVLILAVIYIIVDVARSKPGNLISLGGMAVFILLLFIFSSNPAKVQWRPVIWGMLLQFIFAVMILRTHWGYASFAYLGDRVNDFLAFADSGSKFVFGDLYMNHFFAFKALPVVVFFSTFISMMYYLGLMQFIIRNAGRFLAFCLGTSPAESINAASNIFIGQGEAPLMVRPFIADMTLSELHAVLTGGFATISGSVMAAYIAYGVSPNHLLSASVMSAPAALAISKLFYPETETVRHRGDAVYNLQKGTERNIIEAASTGATMAVKLVANIAVNLIAFVAILNWVNSTLMWFGERVGLHDPLLTFQLICSYIFYPISFLMGVDPDDRLKIGELIGTKTFLNELIAYTDLSVYINNRKIFDQYLTNFTLGLLTHPTGDWEYRDGGIFLKDLNRFLEKGLMTEHSVVIATYALCGFSNLSSMGMMLGALGGIAPSRHSDISGLVFRTMIAGNVACFMTACIAGLLSA